MTYRLQYNSSEYRGLLASSLAAWAAEDRDLAIVSLEGHVLYTSRRLLALFSPALAPLLASSHPTTLTTSLSLPYSSSTLTALLSLLTSGLASCSSPLGREVEELASLLSIPINFNTPSAIPWGGKKKNTSLSLIPVKEEVELPLEELDPTDTPSKKDRRRLTRKGFTCAICQKSYDRKALLNKHMANDHTEVSAESVVHGEIHKKIASHECEVCHKSFQSSGALRMHGAIHLPEKPFKCHLCEWQGTQKGNFKIHLMKRHGEDPANILDLSDIAVTAEMAQDEEAKEVEEEGVIGQEVVVEEQGEGVIGEEMMVEMEEEVVGRSGGLVVG